MTARSRAAATASLMGAVLKCGLGCGANAEEPQAALIAVSPPTAYNDSAASLLIEGGPFRPAYDFDTMGGGAKTELSDFSARLLPASGGGGAGSPISLDPVSWLSAGALAATLPAGVPAGVYDVDLADPRGQHIMVSGAFQSLGSDTLPPVVTVVKPQMGAIIGAQTTVVVQLSADDGAGMLASLTAKISSMAGPLHDGPCTVPPAAQATTCFIEITAPAPIDDQDMIVVDALATDSAGNQGPGQAMFRLAPQPSLTSLAPTVGPAAGGTLIDLHGTDFVAPDGPLEGSRLLLDGVPLDPVEAMVTVSSTEITAVLPAHDAGFAVLTVATGDAETDPIYFEFVAAAIVKAISPTHGSVSGGTAIAVVGDHFRDGATTILVADRELQCPRFVSAQRIEGIVPAGAATGPVTVAGVDPIGGTGMLFDAFTYDPDAADAPDGGAGPTSCGGSP